MLLETQPRAKALFQSLTALYSKQGVATPSKSDDESSDTVPYTGINTANKIRKEGESSKGKRKDNNSPVSVSKKLKNNSAQEDGISIPNESDMDDKVNDLCHDISSEDSEDEETDVMLDNIAKDLVNQNEAGLPISDKVATLFNSIVANPLSSDKLSEKLKSYLRPNNCNLETKLVNPDIWTNVLSSKQRSYDVKLQRVQNLLVKSTTGLLRSVDDLVKAKNDKTMTVKTMRKSMNSVIQQNMDALALLANAHRSNEQIRREYLSYTFVPEERALANNVPYDSKLLFGDDISKRLNEVNGTTKLKSGKHRMPKAKNAYRFPKTPGNQRTYGYQQGQKYPKKPFYQTKKHKKQ